MSDLDTFANEQPVSRAEAFQETAARLGFSQAIIEKDFWVCWGDSRRVSEKLRPMIGM